MLGVSQVSRQDLKDFGRTAGRVLHTDVYSDRGEKYGIIEFATKVRKWCSTFFLQALNTDTMLRGRRIWRKLLILSTSASCTSPGFA
jgi:hypothetical protein